MLSNSFMMKCTIIGAVSNLCRIKVSVTVFCVFNIISVAPGAQGGLILSQIPLCLAQQNTNLNSEGKMKPGG